MHETYRMLGREHELDLVREARNRRLARSLPRETARTKTAAEQPRPQWSRFVPRLFVAWVGR